MRNLVIYLTALSTLSSSQALRHGSHQLRDLLAFPKYQIDYLNELPLSASDAKKCASEGIELEVEFTKTRFEGRRHLGSNDTQVEEGTKVSLAGYERVD
jgi:protein OS-9